MQNDSQSLDTTGLGMAYSSVATLLETNEIQFYFVLMPR